MPIQKPILPSSLTPWVPLWVQPQPQQNQTSAMQTMLPNQYQTPAPNPIYQTPAPAQQYQTLNEPLQTDAMQTMNYQDPSMISTPQWPRPWQIIRWAWVPQISTNNWPEAWQITRSPQITEKVKTTGQDGTVTETIKAPAPEPLATPMPDNNIYDANTILNNLVWGNTAFNIGNPEAFKEAERRMNNVNILSQQSPKVVADMITSGRYWNASQEMMDLAKYNPQFYEQVKLERNNRQTLDNINQVSENVMANVSWSSQTNKNQIPYIGKTQWSGEIVSINIPTAKKWGINARVDSVAAPSLQTAFQQMASAGLLPQVNQAEWTHRTGEQQQELYNRLSLTGATVAKPWTSKHEKGLSVDITNVTPEMANIMNANGWYQTVGASDKWHFDYLWGNGLEQFNGSVNDILQQKFGSNAEKYVGMAKWLLQTPEVVAQAEKVRSATQEANKIKSQIDKIEWDARKMLGSEVPESFVWAYIARQTKDLTQRRQAANNVATTERDFLNVMKDENLKVLDAYQKGNALDIQQQQQQFDNYYKAKEFDLKYAEAAPIVPWSYDSNRVSQYANYVETWKLPVWMKDWSAAANKFIAEAQEWYLAGKEAAYNASWFTISNPDAFVNTTQPQKKSINEAIAQVQPFIASIDKVKELVKKHWTENAYSEWWKAINREIRNAQLLAKEIYNLWVLNWPDLSLMESIITNPTSLWSNLTFRQDYVWQLEDGKQAILTNAAQQAKTVWLLYQWQQSQGWDPLWILQ